MYHHAVGSAADQEVTMHVLRILFPLLGVCAMFIVAAAGHLSTEASAQSGASEKSATVGNPITGEGLPNPAPKVIRNWGQLPEGRKWGSSAGVDIDPKDGHIWAYERCGAGTFGAGAPVTCETNPVDPVFKFDRDTGKVLANFGAGLMVTPHGIHVDAHGNVWIADFAGNKEETKGHQVHKFSPTGEKLLSLGIAGKPGNADGQFDQPNDVVVGPDGSIYVSDGHDGQGMTTNAAIAEGLKRGATARISKFTPDGKFIKSWGRLGVRHGEFRTPHALVFDAKGRLWVADRGNHRIEIFDQEGNYLESRYMYGRISGIFIKGNLVYAIDSESGPLNHQNWRNGVRIGPLDEDRITAFVPPFDREDRVYQGTAGEGVAVDAEGNVYAAEGPNSLAQAGGAFTKYSVK
jgi:DNA-binding beta-propeller fold protein YncE